jgi:serine/threonine-protein kinase
METVKDTAATAPFPQVAEPALPAIPGYEVLALVGRGGMGKVYRARHVALGRIVALKLLAQEPDDNLLARFREEARAVAKLQHPNIAQLFETGLADGRPFYTQEFLDGGTLAHAYGRKPQDPRAAARTVEVVARAIQHSHDNGILHRDLKPGNILLAADSTPKVTDFGLAKTFSPAEPGATTADGGLTRTGEIVGTPGYMPPEQASGVVTSIGPGVDIYALGAILYEVLTGRPPFQAPDPLQALLMVLSMDPVAPRTLQPDVPRDLETICLKCLEKSPRKRYASAGELADDLRRFLNGEPIKARPVGRVERAVKWARRKPWQAAAAGLGVLLVASLAVGMVWFAEKNREVRAANESLGRSNAETQRTLELTLYALDRYFFEFSDHLRDLPKSEKLRLTVLTDARQTLDNLHQFRPDDVLLQNYRMAGYEKLGNIESAMGDVRAAEADYRTSLEITEALAARFPDDPRYRRNRVLLVAKLAGLAARRGDAKAADAAIESVTPLMRDVVAEAPDDPRVLELRAVIENQLADRDMRAGRWDRVESRLRALCDIARRRQQAEPDRPARALEVIAADTHLAILFLDLQRLDDAGRLLKSAADGVGRLTESDTVAARKLRAYVHATVGDYHDRRKEHPQAVRELTAAVEGYAALAAEFPDSPMLRYEYAGTLRYLAQATILAGQVAPGMKHLERCAELLAALTRDYPTDAKYRELHAYVADQLARLKKLQTPPDKKP